MDIKLKSKANQPLTNSKISKQKISWDKNYKKAFAYVLTINHKELNLSVWVTHKTTNNATEMIQYFMESSFCPDYRNVKIFNLQNQNWPKTDFNCNRTTKY